MLIHVTSHLGQTTDLVVMADDTVLSLKEKIAEEEGTPVQHQRLIFLHQTMDDSRTMAEYRIRKGSVIHLAQSITGNSGIRILVYKEEHMTYNLIRVYGNESPLVLKEKVSDVVGVAVCDMDVVFHGRHLCDYSRLSELNLDPWFVYGLSVVPVYGRRYPEIAEVRYELRLAVL
ncbi:uncharacterized protein [Haliotis cracherodii]|uniref:uncharacterized protein n=1 Tax=Haliotis cracherodii TaxID=6455 RepID=UPI0039EC67FB